MNLWPTSNIEKNNSDSHLCFHSKITGESLQKLPEKGGAWVKHPRPKCPKRQEEFPFVRWRLRPAATPLGVFVCFYLHNLKAEEGLMNQGKGFCFLLTWRWVSSLQTRRVKNEPHDSWLKRNHLESVRRRWERGESSLLLREGLRCTVQLIPRSQSARKSKICAGRDQWNPALVWHSHSSSQRPFQKKKNPHADVLNLQLCHR